MIEFFGTIFIIALGFVGHFIYGWSDNSKIAGYFFAVNESTWEHIKLALVPSLLWFIVECFLYNGNEFLFFAKSIALLSIIILIPAFFYGYKMVLKKSILAIDIGCFFISVIISQVLFNILINITFSSGIYNVIGIVLFIVILLSTFLLTKFPPKNIIFEDPVTKTYGFQKK